MAGCVGHIHDPVLVRGKRDFFIIPEHFVCLLLVSSTIHPSPLIFLGNPPSQLSLPLLLIRPSPSPPLLNSTFGFNFSWGVYQEHYVNENIFPGAGLTEISWGGTIGAGSVFITGPFQSSMIRQFGTRPIVAVGIVISACGLVAASFVTKVWQLYLTQVSKRRGRKM